MRKFGSHRVSRRKLLGGAAAASAVPVLHELIPHQGLHGGTAPAAAAVSHHHAAGHQGSGHRGAVGRVAGSANSFDPAEIVRDFDEGTLKDGVREWEIVAEDREIEVAPGVKYAAWTYNGRVPGPTLRAREGERLRVRFVNGSSHPHTIHFHGIHRDLMDGIPGIGAGNVAAGDSTVYEFDATPFGLHLYHCHSTPLAEHIAKGLYGAFVIDPADGRPDADELVMVMNGFDTNFDRANEVYAVNTVAFAYMHDPIRVKRGELVRIYLVNALEFDFVNSFHIHANFFDYYPTGTRLEPRDFTDTVVQGQGERGILELRFPYAGKYMFHAHVSEFAELGWMGFFQVED
jgi:FtsP/CotA-like multicopper oxidase with cupredoxin domain